MIILNTKLMIFKMLNKGLILLVFVLSFNSLPAQNIDSARYAIGIQLPQLLVKEMVLTATVPLKRDCSITFLGGYRFKTGGKDRISGIGHGNVPDYPDQLMINPFAQAIRFGVMPTYYAKSSNGTFFAAELFYRNWWINKERFAYESGESVSPKPEVKLNSLNEHVIGLKLLVGGRIGKIQLSKRTFFDLRYFVGASFRLKKNTLKSWKIPVDTDQNVNSYSESGYWFAPQFGIVSEIAWK